MRRCSRPHISSREWGASSTSSGSIGTESWTLAKLGAAVGRDTAVVSVMTVNNETGTLQPITEVVEAVKRSNSDTLVHTDAVQAFSNLDLNLSEIRGRPAFAGGSQVRWSPGGGAALHPVGRHIEPLLHGGGQEYGRRSGTHNVAGIAGMAAAMAAAAADRDRFRR